MVSAFKEIEMIDLVSFLAVNTLGSSTAHAEQPGCARQSAQLNNPLKGLRR